MAGIRWHPAALRGAAGLTLGLLAAAAAAAPASPARGPGRPPNPAGVAAAAVSFEEVMADGRALGAVRFSPDGQKVLVSVERNDRPTGGAPWKLTATQAFVWSRATRTLRPLGAAGEAFLPALCEPWSPDGRFIAGLVLRDGQRRLAAFDLVTSRLAVFGPPPLTMCPTWVGDRLAYPAAAPGGFDGASALPAAEALLARWRQAWSGSTAQVTAHSNNPDFPGPERPEGRLVVADPVSGQAETFARGDFHSLTPSPDGRRLAVVRLGRPDPQALSRQSARIGNLQVYGLTDDGRAAPLWTAADFDTDFAGLAWSPDGGRLLAGGRIPSQSRLGLLDLDAGTGAARPVRVPPGARLGAGRRGAFSVLRPLGWIGGRPAFIAAVDRDLAAPSDGRSVYGEAGRGGFGLFVDTADAPRDLTHFAHQSVTAFAATGDGRALVAADGALWAVSPDAPPRRLSPATLTVAALAEARPSYGLPPVFAVAAHRAAVKVRTGGGGSRLAVLDLVSGAVTLSRPAVEVAQLSPDLHAWLRIQSNGWAQSLDLEGARGGEILAVNAPWRGRPTGAIEPFDYVVDGRRLRGWIVQPPGPPAGPRPAIMWIYGGDVHDLAPPAEARPGRAPTPLFSAQLWAACGYAVIYPSTPLTPAASSDVPAVLAREAEAAVDAAATHGWIDPDRVGLIGHSFGGYSTAAVLSRSHRFRAGVAISGTYDFIASWGARQPLETLTDEDGHDFAEETRGFLEAGQIGLGAPPYAAPEAYLRASPLFAAPGLQTPLLLMAGDLDQGATSLGQAERMYAALRRSGSPAAVVRYWGQDHVQDDPWAVEDQWRRATAWLGRYLGADAPGAPRATCASVPTERQTTGPARPPQPAPDQNALAAPNLPIVFEHRSIRSILPKT